MTLLWLLVIVNYNKSEMHQSCKTNTVAYSSPPQLIFFYDWKPATAPPPPPPPGVGWGGGFAPLSLPLNDIFSQKLAF